LSTTPTRCQPLYYYDPQSGYEYRCYPTRTKGLYFFYEGDGQRTHVLGPDAGPRLVKLVGELRAAERLRNRLKEELESDGDTEADLDWSDDEDMRDDEDEAEEMGEDEGLGNW
jgi:hypothetical protein